MENQEQKPIPETPVTSEQPTKKAKPKWIVPVIVIAGIIVLGVGVWAGYNYWLKPAASEEQPSEEQQQEEQNEFADWKTYRNEEYGFEFKYPQEFGTVKIEEFTQILPVGEKGRGMSLHFLGSSFWVTIFFPEQYKEYDLICETEEINREWVEYCKNIVIENQNISHAVALEYMPEASGPFMVQRAKLYLRQKNLKGEIRFNQDFSEINDHLDQFYTGTSEGDAELEKIAYDYLEKLYNNDPAQPETKLVSQFEKILSTFKFIELDEIADWEVYRNEEFGFEFKYPAEWGEITKKDKYEISNPPSDYVFNFTTNEVTPILFWINDWQNLVIEPGPGEFYLEGGKNTWERRKENENLHKTEESCPDEEIGFLSDVSREEVTCKILKENELYIFQIDKIAKNDSFKQASSIIVTDDKEIVFSAPLKYKNTLNQILSTFKFIDEDTTGKPSVVILTDKTEYEKGEIIKITLNNRLDSSILYSDPVRFWSIEKFESGEWISPAYEEGGGFQLTDKNIEDDCYIILYERSYPLTLDSESNLSHEWNQKICPFVTGGPDKPKTVKYIQSGQYRLIFIYGFEISDNDPFTIKEFTKIYSAPFIIKESS